MSAKLDELLKTEVAILDCDSQEIIQITTVDGITDGFDSQVELNNGVFQLVSYDSTAGADDLGETISEALQSLNKYREMFNNLDDEDESWESNFLYSLNNLATV